MLVHWYLDKDSGQWTLDHPCGTAVNSIWWAGGGCSSGVTTCSVAVAPLYLTSAKGACQNDLCSKALVFSPGFSFMGFSGSQMANQPTWAIPSDNGRIDNSSDTRYQSLDPTSYTTMDSEVNAAMRQMWQLIGVVAGPPPFDGTQFVKGEDLSSVEFEKSSTSSTETSSTQSTNFSFGNTTKMGPPFARTKIGFQASMGASVTHGEGTSITLSIDDELGYDNEPDTLAGQMGWAIMSAPVITPQNYQAVWAVDNTTTLGYTQVATVISDRQKLVFPFRTGTKTRRPSTSRSTSVPRHGAWP